MIAKLIVLLIGILFLCLGSSNDRGPRASQNSSGNAIGVVIGLGLIALCIFG